MANKHKLKRRQADAVGHPELNPHGTKKVQISKVQTGVKEKSFLIHFDRPSRIFIIILVICYLFASFFKLHTSSVGYWDTYLGKEGSGTVISGTPKYIRMDEWMVSTPGLVGQYFQGMPLKNKAVGEGNTPVVWGYPVKDISSILRPNHWSYFLMDVERAFSFSWNFTIFGFLLSTFLLFKILTRNQFWISVFGSFFIFLSSAMQWWSYTIGNYMMYMNIALIGLLFILYSKKPIQIIAGGFLLLFGAYGYLFNLYPPFQVPLVYLYAFIFLGFIIQRKEWKLLLENKYWKWGVFAGVVVVFAVFSYRYYLLVADTYKMIMNTVYPGKRVSLGGDLPGGKFFAEFFGMFMNETVVPPSWLNICEASGFVFFFPVIFYAMAHRFIKSRKADPVLVFLSVFVIIFGWYTLVGFPEPLSRLSLISMSPAFRALPILQLGNCILLVCFLGTIDKEERFEWNDFFVFTALTILFFFLVGNSINNSVDKYFSPGQVSFAMVFFAIVYLLIRYKFWKYSIPVILILLTALNLRNIGVNPLSAGLSALTENPLVEKTKAIHENDPAGRWAVFSNESMVSSNIANLLKAGGLSVFNGVKLVPDLKENRFLNPSITDSVYNRYAHIDMYMFIDWKDTVIFTKKFNDAYLIQIDPCSPKLKQLNVRYMVFTYKPQDVEVRCMTLLHSSPYYIYKTN